MRFFKSERGKVDLSNIVMLGIALIMATIGAYFVNPLIAAFDTARTNASVGNFTAADTVIKIGPTLIILGYVVAVAVVGFLGIRGITKGG